MPQDLAPGVAARDLSPGELQQAQADALHRTLPLAMASTTALCSLFAGLYPSSVATADLMVWLALGLAALLLRFELYRRYRRTAQSENRARQVTRFLQLCSGASGIAGLMFAWGWLALAPSLGRSEFAGLAYANIALLLTGLYADSIFVPAFLAFLLTSLPPALYAVYHHHQPSEEWLVSTVGLMVIGLVSLLFAVRSANAFRINLALQARVFRLLEEVTSKRDEAVRATQAKSRFLASASHDLRQPMHAINLYLASLEDGFLKYLATPSETRALGLVRESIGSLKESTRYLNRMFESLLDVSRLDAGAIAVEIRYCSLHHLFLQLDNEFSDLAAAEGLNFETKLPPQFSEMEIRTDPVLLERLLRNLLANAFRYTRTGGIRLRVVAIGDSVDFRVIDTGPGIPRGMRGRVFEEFFQVPSVMARDGVSGAGMGLGLSISARMAEKLETRLRISSHVRLGSVFAVRQAMRVVLGAAGEEPPLHATRPTPFNPETLIAIIDDDAEIRRSGRLMLESLGATVFTAENGEAAVQQLGAQGQQPQLILCDYHLTGSNGIETIARLREEFNRDIPAILITGETSSQEMAFFRDSLLRVLYKPLSGDQLLTAIRQELVSVSSFSPGNPGAAPPEGPGYD